MRFNETKGALYALCISRAGYRDGIKLIEFVDEWRRCVERHDRSVTMNEFVAWTRRYSQRRAYELLVLFRRHFPQLGPDGTPEGLMRPLLERLP